MPILGYLKETACGGFLFFVHEVGIRRVKYLGLQV